MLKVYTCTGNAAMFMNILPQHYAPIESACADLEFTHLESFDELVRRIAEPDIIVCWRFPQELYTKASKLKAVFTPAAGREMVDADPSGRVPVSYGSYHGEIMAETLLAMILYFNNRFHIAAANQTACRWERNAQWPMTSLRGQHVAIIGYGAIGRQCARTLALMGCRVTGVQRTISEGHDPLSGAEYALFSDIKNVVNRADHVVLILPSEPQTHQIISREILSSMKPTAYLYNIGRGTVVNEDDLVWVLQNKVIAGAGLDVFAQEPLPPASPLWSCPNTLILPHTSAAYTEYASLFIKELSTKLKTLL